MNTTEIVITLRHITCCRCGCVFGMSEKHQQERRDDHRSFYCPNGHSNYYPSESREERLERQLRAANSQRTHLSDQLQAEKRSAAALRGHITRMKKRIANGVCPCCNRSFANVRRHMQTQHPEVLQKIRENEGG